MRLAYFLTASAFFSSSIIWMMLSSTYLVRGLVVPSIAAVLLAGISVTCGVMFAVKANDAKQ